MRIWIAITDRPYDDLGVDVAVRGYLDTGTTDCRAPCSNRSCRRHHIPLVAGTDTPRTGRMVRGHRPPNSVRSPERLRRGCFLHRRSRHPEGERQAAPRCNAGSWSVRPAISAHVDERRSGRNGRVRSSYRPTSFAGTSIQGNCGRRSPEIREREWPPALALSTARTAQHPGRPRST